MNDIHIKIGRKINKIRRNKGLSLDKLADLTGVSKSMLGQIERGESIPTVTTLWKIATGLRMSFTSLLEEEKSAVSVVSVEDIEPLYGEGQDYRVFPFFPFDPKKQFEIFLLEFGAGYVHNAESHNVGVEEYLIITKGKLEVEVDSETFTIHEGNAIRFFADLPHIYRNLTEEITKAILVLYYPL